MTLHGKVREIAQKEERFAATNRQILVFYIQGLTERGNDSLGYTIQKSVISDINCQFETVSWNILTIVFTLKKSHFKSHFPRNPLDKAFGHRNFVSYIQAKELIALLRSLSGLMRMCS
jgi:hypothetical protein